ncbi:MAG TPA: cytochrome c oxidase subunit II [Opitutaceae bacterium]
MKLIALVELWGTPGNASTLAPEVDLVFWVLCLISTLLVAFLVVVNLVFLIKYRRGSPAYRGPLPIESWKVEATWITATTIAFLYFFFWGARIYLKMEQTPADAYQVTLIGRQWMWDVRHPNGRREFNTMHVPLGQNIAVQLSSEDVIHSFYVPAFRVKQDVVPGKTVTAWFNATREGEYPFYCSEFCGTKHSAMIGTIVVQSPEAYGQWLDAGTRSEEMVQHGRELFIKYNCAGCHDQPSTIHAPSLVGIYNREVPLSTGKFVRADERYIRDSILLPTKDIVAGFQPIMPSFQGVVNEADLLDLINYIKSLTPENASSPAATVP